jgi:CRP-like cAMP-binding protein
VLRVKKDMDAYRPLARLITRLERATSLSIEEQKLIDKIPISIRSFDTHHDIVRHGEFPSQCCILLSGQLVRNKITESSRRQIISFHVPGDLPDLHSLYLSRADHNLSSLGPTIVGLISHRFLRELMQRSPAITQALWRETLVEASIFREWAISLGGREAISRVAHLLCEMAIRLGAVNLAKNHTFTLPWTQQDIGDACGLSNVHVNRVIQTLRSNDVIDWRSRVMRITRWEELERIAEFTADYLHLPTNHRNHADGTQANSTRFEVRP